jgi:hypothetical protein
MILMKQFRNTFDELIEFYRKHGGGFVEDKVCCVSAIMTAH